MHGYEPEELRDKPFAELVDSENRATRKRASERKITRFTNRFISGRTAAHSMRSLT